MKSTKQKSNTHNITGICVANKCDINLIKLQQATRHFILWTFNVIDNNNNIHYYYFSQGHKKPNILIMIYASKLVMLPALAAASTVSISAHYPGPAFFPGLSIRGDVCGLNWDNGIEMVRESSNSPNFSLI